MEKKLISLEEHNKKFGIGISSTGDLNSCIGEKTCNGIACPKCGDELFDTDPRLILLSFPAQTSTMCKKCGYTGHRFC